MSDNRGIFRNVNILHELNVSTGTDVIEVYQPGWLTPYDVSINTRFSGFITSLRLTVEIKSIAEMQVIATELTDSQEEIDNKSSETFNNNYKKCLSFFMKTSDTPTIKIADVYCFNRQPFYYIDLLPFFTNAATFDIAPDTMITCQIQDVGSGILQLNDRIVILGSVVEESPLFDQDYITSE